jgi:hypothetical protein
MSLFLSGVQVIEANNSSSSGWEAHDDGFVAEESSAPVVDSETTPDVSDDDIPF